MIRPRALAVVAGAVWALALVAHVAGVYDRLGDVIGDAALAVAIAPHLVVGGILAAFPPALRRRRGAWAAIAVLIGIASLVIATTIGNLVLEVAR